MGREGERRQEIFGLTPSLGSCICYDDFEGVFKWESTGTGEGWVVEKSQEMVFRGDYSLKCTTRVEGSADEDFAQASQRVYLGPSRKVWFDCIFRFQPESVVKYVRWYFGLFGMGLWQRAYIQYNVGYRKWEYRDKGGVYRDVPGGDKWLFGDTWHRMFVEVDFGKGEYVMMGADVDVFDLRGVKLEAEGDANNFFDVYVEVVCKGFGSATAYFDEYLMRDFLRSVGG